MTLVPTRIVCPRCLGDGALEAVGGPGRWRTREESWEPEEATTRCELCWGEGWLESCESCGRPLDESEGLDSCRCDELGVQRAA